VQERGPADATLTTLAPAAIEPLGTAPVPAPCRVRAPRASWEALEGMRVRIAVPLTIAAADDRDGSLLASFGGRLFVPTEVAAPGPHAQRVAADNARRRLVLAPPAPVPAPRTGGVIPAATGILAQHAGTWRLHLDAPPKLAAASRPQAPAVRGDVRIASLNLENLFNGDGRGGGFPTPRGARDAAGLARQLAKHAATLQALDPDVVALMELENDGFGPESSLAALVAALNRGGGDWRHVDAGQGPGDDEIRVGLLYRAGRVAPVGRPATLVGGPFGTRSRAPLAQAFRAGDGPVFVVVANHFKSKGCGDAEGPDRDQRDGQACWNALRTDSARRLDAWLRTDPTGTGSELTVLLGDLNAYAQEDPVRALANAGWVDAFAARGVRAPYSYVYRGESGRLDHALLSPALARRLAGAAEWHSNADEPESAGYRDGGPGPWRSSDHDPLLLGFALRRPASRRPAAGD
jgi:hypothetical protein